MKQLARRPRWWLICRPRSTDWLSFSSNAQAATTTEKFTVQSTAYSDLLRLPSLPPDCYAWDRASQKFLGDSNAVHDCELSVALPAQKEAPQAAVLIRVKHVLHALTAIQRR